MAPPISELLFPYRIARIAGAYGLQGEVHVQLFRPRIAGAEPSGQKKRAVKLPMPIELEFKDESLRNFELTHIRWIDPIRFVATLSGVTDRDQAEELVGTYLDVEPSLFSPRIADEVDRAFGARVFGEEGELLGEVTSIKDNGAQALLSVGDDDALLIPFVEAFILEQGQDEEGEFVKVRLPDGLLGVNQK